MKEGLFLFHYCPLELKKEDNIIWLDGSKNLNFHFQIIYNKYHIVEANQEMIFCDDILELFTVNLFIPCWN